MKALSISPTHHFKGTVHCPICTHTVEAEVISTRRRAFSKPGQKCPRCSATLDAAYVLRFEKAA
jgi:transposase-like protein